LSGHAPTPPTGGRVGMWLFLATEILLFGGLFLLYAMYRLKTPLGFHAGTMELSRFLGTLNTCILITSSFTLTLAVHALNNNRKSRAINLTGVTIALALGFLAVKAVEWTEKFHHGLYPRAAVLMAKSKGEVLYFGLYYMMTGLHALHIVAGIGVLVTAMLFISKGRVTPQRPIFFENAGLYWHLVDVGWAFLFPLFYLIS